jgi:hypothetical protein
LPAGGRVLADHDRLDQISDDRHQVAPGFFVAIVAGEDKSQDQFLARGFQFVELVVEDGKAWPAHSVLALDSRH